MIKKITHTINITKYYNSILKNDIKQHNKYITKWHIKTWNDVIQYKTTWYDMTYHNITTSTQHNIMKITTKWYKHNTKEYNNTWHNEIITTQTTRINKK